MGRFSQKKHEEANDLLLNSVAENDKIESLKEVLNLLSQTADGNTKLAAVIDARITAAIGAAIGEGGAIETWADGRYEAKSE